MFWLRPRPRSDAPSGCYIVKLRRQCPLYKYQLPACDSLGCGHSTFHGPDSWRHTRPRSLGRHQTNGPGRRREARLCGESHRCTGARAYRWYLATITVKLPRCHLAPTNSYPQTSCWTTKFVVICRTEETCDQDLLGHYKSSNK